MAYSDIVSHTAVTDVNNLVQGIVYCRIEHFLLFSVATMPSDRGLLPIKAFSKQAKMKTEHGKQNTGY